LDALPFINSEAIYLGSEDNKEAPRKNRESEPIS
jgi:hypothetical protein